MHACVKEIACRSYRHTITVYQDEQESVGVLGQAVSKGSVAVVDLGHHSLWL